MRSLFFLMPCLLVLGSCGSPPKPPTVDESLRRPANTAMAVELQVCKNDLQNTRIVATESSRLAETNASTLERLAVRQQVLAAMQAQSAQIAQANGVFTVRFDFGSTRVVVPADTSSALIDSARAAPLVLLRGRTDGATESAAESRIARERAAAVRDYLVGAGVDPARIRATYQPAGDYVTDNSSPAGRGMNRRVEIEVYRALPVAMNASTVASPPALP
jgi:outer membrane protein OmpA-like peptidoglycan-associated protein